MKKNTNTIKILSVIIFVLIIALAFVVLNINKTGNAVKGLDKMNLGNNVTVEQTKDGPITTVYWTVENEDGTVSSKKLSTLTTDASGESTTISCELTCNGSSCAGNGCDSTIENYRMVCSAWSCTGAGCQSTGNSCKLSKVDSVTWNHGDTK